MTEFDVTPDSTSQPKSMSSYSCWVGSLLMRYVFPWYSHSASLRSSLDRACGTKDHWAMMPPSIRLLNSTNRSPTNVCKRLILPILTTRRFFFLAKMSMTPASNSGATTTSAYWLAMASAVALSTGRFTAIQPPKAATRSAIFALIYASSKEAALATPQGLLCLTMTTAGLCAKYLRMFKELSASVRFVFPGCLPDWSSSISEARYRPG